MSNGLAGYQHQSEDYPRFQGDRPLTTKIITNTLDHSIPSEKNVEQTFFSLGTKTFAPRDKTIAELSMGILNKWDQNSEGFLRQIVTEDETWFYQYNPDDKAQSKQKTSQPGGKVMATTFWKSEGILLVDILKAWGRVTSAHYKSVLRKLATNLVKCCGKLFQSFSTMTMALPKQGGHCVNVVGNHYTP